jgi:antitoxin PrlF
MADSMEWRATMSSKGQLVLPAELRSRLGLVQGSVLRLVADEAGVHLLPVAGDVRRLKGRLAKPGRPVSVDDMQRTVAERRARVARG